nr:hypothetical protein mPipKuh1_009968 [Pipistrellus kuhlii]
MEGSSETGQALPSSHHQAACFWPRESGREHAAAGCVVGGAGGWPGRGWGCHLVPQAGVVAFLCQGPSSSLQACLGTPEQEPPSLPITGRPRTVAGHPGGPCCLRLPDHRRGNRLSHRFSPNARPSPALGTEDPQVDLPQLLSPRAPTLVGEADPRPPEPWNCSQMDVRLEAEAWTRSLHGPVCRGQRTVSQVCLQGGASPRGQVPGKEAEAAQARKTGTEAGVPSSIRPLTTGSLSTCSFRVRAARHHGQPGG